MRPFAKEILALGLALSLSSCAMVESIRCLPHGEETRFVGKWETCFNNDDDGFKADSIAHPIYCFPGDPSQASDRKPPVLLLHELPGLSGKTLEYARELSNEFTVYVPLLFGKPNSQSMVHGTLLYFGLNDEWWGLEDGDSKVVAWLRALVKEVEQQHQGQSIGVIGNCLTGSLPLTLLDNPHIQAVVLAQPTLPLTIFRNDGEVRKSLGISKDEIEQAKKSPAKIFYVRFDTDCVSKREKLGAVREKFPGRVSELVIPHDQHSVKNAHSTLIGEWRVEGEAAKASRDARDEVKRFLRDPVNFRSGHER
ncbi:MAG: dienelactone hydrolase family protein [Nitrospira sp.]|nr:dienelactone hydrolase family protein [Nitrospira sp.]